MQKKRLGNSDMELTRIGVGAWAMGGGGWAFAWGPQDDDESISAIHAALDHGVNWIDTAAVYGLGHSEEVVARALAGRSNKPYVFTKCERTWNEKREIQKVLKRDSIRKECEDSLRRLKLDAIDLYQIHWPEPEEDVEEGWETLARLKEEGKVRWIGVSNFTVAQLERCRAIAPVTSLQPPYSAVSPEVEQTHLPYCQEHGIGVIVYSPMKSGLLTGKMTRERVAALPEDDFRASPAVFGGFAGGGADAPAVLPGARNRRDRVFADEVGAADGQDDAGTGGGTAGRRFPATGAGIPGTATDA